MSKYSAVRRRLEREAGPSVEKHATSRPGCRWPAGIGASLLSVVVQRARRDARSGTRVDAFRLGCRRQPHHREGSLHQV